MRGGWAVRGTGSGRDAGGGNYDAATTMRRGGRVILVGAGVGAGLHRF